MNSPDPALRERFVYRIYDADGGLLNVGCTKRPDARWKERKSLSPWWARRAKKFRLAGPFNYDTARAIEREALRVEEPQFGWTDRLVLARVEQQPVGPAPQGRGEMCGSPFQV